MLWRVAAAPTPGSAGVTGLAGAIGLAGLALALGQRLAGLLPWALAALAATYLLGLPVHAGTLAAAAGYGLGLFLVAELGYLSLESTTAVRGERGTARPRWLLVGAVVVVAALADDLAFGAAYLSTGGGLLLTAAVAAVLLLVAVVAALVRPRSGAAGAPPEPRGEWPPGQP